MSMRTGLITIAITIGFLALCHPNAYAAQIILEKDRYWQVQNAKTYRIVCEGNLSVCIAPSNTKYHIIDLGTGERKNNVLIGDQYNVNDQVIGNVITPTLKSQTKSGKTIIFTVECN